MAVLPFAASPPRRPPALRPVPARVVEHKRPADVAESSMAAGRGWIRGAGPVPHKAREKGRVSVQSTFLVAHCARCFGEVEDGLKGIQKMFRARSRGWQGQKQAVNERKGVDEADGGARKGAPRQAKRAQREGVTSLSICAYSLATIYFSFTEPLRIPCLSLFAVQSSKMRSLEHRKTSNPASRSATHVLVGRSSPRAKILTLCLLDPKKTFSEYSKSMTDPTVLIELTRAPRPETEPSTAKNEHCAFGKQESPDATLDSPRREIQTTTI